jgi:Ca2+-binding EF-hand superfamily protein
MLSRNLSPEVNAGALPTAKLKSKVSLSIDLGKNAANVSLSHTKLPSITGLPTPQPHLRSLEHRSGIGKLGPSLLSPTSTIPLFNPKPADGPNLLDRRQAYLAKLRQKTHSISSKTIIITEGRSIIKKEIFRLKAYFDKMSGQQNEVTIKEFTRAFEYKPHMHKVIASLFNFLDSTGKNFITFSDLITKLYPNLNAADRATIEEWLNEYHVANGFMAINTLDREEFKKKFIAENLQKEIPKDGVKKLKSMFEQYDDHHKGCNSQLKIIS